LATGIELIIGDIDAKTKEQVERIIKDAEKKIEEINKTKKEAAERDKQKILEKGKSLADRERQRILADARIKAKKEFLEEKERIINEIIDKATDKLRQIVESKEYEKKLFDLLKKSVDIIDENNIEILVNKRDKEILEKHKDKLNKVLGDIKYTIGRPIDCIGGVIVRSENSEVNNTLEARLERSMERLRTDIAKMLFD
jgi:V/A-type H+-transporting ATPase subunit E